MKIYKEDNDMSCYDALLEEFNAEQELANATFASINESMEALYNFVAQDITLEFSIAAESAEDVDALKEAAGEAIKNAALKLKDKLVEWAQKIVEQVKKIAKKAALAAANGGNAAIKKLLNDKAKTKKEVVLKSGKYSAKENDKIVEGLADMTRLSTAGGKAAKIEEIFAKAGTFETTEEKVAPGASVKDLYTKYVDAYVNKFDYKAVSKHIDEAAKSARAEAKKLENPEEAAKVKEGAVQLMKAGTTLVTFAFQNLTLGVANAAKIALACGVAKKKEEAPAAAEA